jgi:hypothetical protein
VTFVGARWGTTSAPPDFSDSGESVTYGPRVGGFVRAEPDAGLRLVHAAATALRAGEPAWLPVSKHLGALLAEAGVDEGSHEDTKVFGESNEVTPCDACGCIVATAELADVASYGAALLGRRLVIATTLASAARTASASGERVLLLIGTLWQFDAEVLALTWELQAEGKLCGLLPCRSTGEACDWFAKWYWDDSLYGDHRGALVLARDTSASYFDDEHELLVESTFTTASRARLQSPHELLVAELHAKECCARFNDTVICGAPSVRSDTGTVSRVGRSLPVVSPGCALGDGCVWTSPRLPIGLVAATHVIAVSCGSVRFDNNLFDSDFGLGLNLFHGPARSLLAPMRFVFRTPVLSAYLADLARSGHTLGEVCARANAFQAETFADGPSFVLLGDPADRLNMLRVINVTDDSRIDRAVAAPPAPLEPHAYASRAAPGILPPASIPSTPSLASTIPSELWRAAGVATGDLHALLTYLAHTDNRGGLWLPLKYGHEACSQRVFPASETCLWCGGACVRYVRTHEREGWSREIVNCPLCGIVSDAPPGAYGRYRIDVPEELRRTEPVAIQAYGERRVSGDAWSGTVSIIHSALFGWEGFEHSVLRHSDSVARRSLYLATDVPASTRRFSYWVRAIWASVEGLVWLSRPTCVRS